VPGARAAVGEECRGHWQWCQDGLMCDGYWPGIDDDHYSVAGAAGQVQRGQAARRGLRAAEAGDR
jgi:hypothetical protein